MSFTGPGGQTPPPQPHAPQGPTTCSTPGTRAPLGPDGRPLGGGAAGHDGAPYGARHGPTGHDGGSYGGGAAGPGGPYGPSFAGTPGGAPHAPPPPKKKS